MVGLGGVGSKMVEAFKGAASAVGAKLSSLMESLEKIGRTSEVNQKINKIDTQLRANQAEAANLTSKINTPGIENKVLQSAAKRLSDIGNEITRLEVEIANLKKRK